MTTHESIVDKRYVALSYCWGTSNTFTLSQKTSNDFALGFSPSCLPPTLQDAVRVTADLGITYLWIDALCIFQDSDGDWTTESSKMASVYGCAFVTVIAANAGDCSNGFFQRSMDNSAVVGNRKHTLSFFKSRDEIISFQDEPINARAWTLQELGLSPRRLVFSTSRTVFTCSQDLKTGQERNLFGKRIWVGLKPVVDLGEWGLVVENYSSRNLTHSEDKLAALAGLAEKFHHASGGELGKYVAGLWEADLPQQLLWRRRNPFNRYQKAAKNERPEEWRAPTWSWASLDGNIDYTLNALGVKRFDRAVVMSVDAPPASEENVFGKVTSGQLTIRGPSLASRTAEGLEIGPVPTEEGPSTLTRRGQEFVTVHFDIESDVDKLSQPTTELHFLAMINSPKETYGLVLKRMGGDKFQRVGLFVPKNSSQWLQESETAVYTIV